MLTIDEFESVWRELLKKYNLKLHPYMIVRDKKEMGKTLLQGSALCKYEGYTEK